MIYKTTLQKTIYKGYNEILRRIIAKMVENKDVNTITILRSIFEVQYATGLDITLTTKENTIMITITSNDLEEVMEKAKEYGKIIEDFLKEQEKKEEKKSTKK